MCANALAQIAMSAAKEVPVVVEVSDDAPLERGPNDEPASASGRSNLAFRDVCFEVTVRKGTGEKERVYCEDSQ